MASPNPNYSDIIATTIENRSRDYADNLTQNNAILVLMQRSGNIQPFSGGSKILEAIQFASAGTGSWYSGYETLPLERNDSITDSEWDIKQAAETIQISGLEMAQNNGGEQIINLLASRIDGAGAALANRVSLAMYSNGTGFAGKEITGLQALVSDAPTTGSPGGIDRAVFTFWRNQVFSGVTNGGAAVSSSNIASYMQRLYTSLQRGTDKPNAIICDSNYYGFYFASLQGIRRIADQRLADLGYANVEFMGIPVIADGGFQGHAPANHMYMLNTKYLKLRPHSQNNFRQLDARYAVNQDAQANTIVWYGNMAMSNAFLQGVLIA